MDADYYRTLFDYGYWARDKLFAALDGLGDEDYARANGFNYNGIRAVLSHCLAAEAGWFASLSRQLLSDRITQDTLPDLETLKTR